MKNQNNYKRYDDYKESPSHMPWYKSIIFTSEITSALWVLTTFIKDVFKKKTSNDKSDMPRQSIADNIRQISSGLLPGARRSGNNYKNIPLAVAVFVCVIVFIVFAGFVFVGFVVVTSR